MASRLAEEGVVTCVATYTLFPQALCRQMWTEVSDAITWTLDNVGGFGGSPDRVTLVGHSAGAQICSMALLHRCGVAGDRHEPPSAPALEMDRDAERETRVDASTAIDRRQPRAFVGLCGVYDIARHYDYEDSRGVALVSTMGRAMGGREKFAECSPLVHVNANANALGGYHGGGVEEATPTDAANVADDDAADDDHTSTSPARKAVEWAPMAVMDTDEILDVEAVVAEARIAEARIATETREKAAVTAIEMPETTATASATATTETTFRRRRRRTSEGTVTTRARRSRRPPAPPRRRTVVRRRTVASGWFPVRPRARSRATTPRARLACSAAATGVTAAARTFRRARDAPGCFPPTFLAAGCADTTVPWFESAEFHWALRDADVPSRVLLYLGNRTPSFVLGWSPRPSGTATEKRHANEANSEENDAKARFPAAAAAAASVSTAAVSATTVSAASTGGSAFAGSAFANAFESDAGGPSGRRGRGERVERQVRRRGGGTRAERALSRHPSRHQTRVMDGRDG